MCHFPVEHATSGLRGPSRCIGRRTGGSGYAKDTPQGPLVIAPDGRNGQPDVLKPDGTELVYGPWEDAEEGRAYWAGIQQALQDLKEGRLPEENAQGS